MKHIVDAHPLLWFFAGSPRLGAAAKAVTGEREDGVFHFIRRSNHHYRYGTASILT